MAAFNWRRKGKVRKWHLLTKIGGVEKPKSTSNFFSNAYSSPGVLNIVAV